MFANWLIRLFYVFCHIILYFIEHVVKLKLKIIVVYIMFHNFCKYILFLTCSIAPSLIFYLSISCIRLGAHKPYRFHAPFVIHWLSTLAYVMSDCCLLCFTCDFAYFVCLTLCICMAIKLFWIWIWIWITFIFVRCLCSSAAVTLAKYRRRYIIQVTSVLISLKLGKITERRLLA